MCFIMTYVLLACATVVGGIKYAVEIKSNPELLTSLRISTNAWDPFDPILVLDFNGKYASEAKLLNTDMSRLLRENAALGHLRGNFV